MQETNNTTPKASEKDNGTIRQFGSGATRDSAADKLDLEGFLCPRVLQAYAEYMHKNRKQSDGSTRDSDNWQKGIPKPVYMKSLWRHFFDAWRIHRGLPAREDVISALCGLLFNAMGYLHEVLKEREALVSPGAPLWATGGNTPHPFDAAVQGGKYAGPGWRLLVVGETIRHGDQYWCDVEGRWNVTASAGFVFRGAEVAAPRVYRRKL